jgi:hypothetical protein
LLQGIKVDLPNLGRAQSVAIHQGFGNGPDLCPSEFSGQEFSGQEFSGQGI